MFIEPIVVEKLVSFLLGIFVGFVLSVLSVGALDYLMTPRQKMNLEFFKTYEKTGTIILESFALRTRVPVKRVDRFMCHKLKQYNGVKYYDNYGNTLFLFGVVKQRYINQNLE